MSYGPRLKGKVAIVTGGGFGLGAGIVKKFCFEGARVVIMDLNEPNAQKVASEQPAGQAVALRGDVSEEASWKSALELALKEFGELDIVVNNAGVVYVAKSSIEVSEADYDRVMNVNVKQHFWSTKVVIPYFRTKGGGLFINISSVSSPRPRPNLVWYAASKGAVTNLTKGMALEFAKENIRFNVIHPVAAETGMVPSFLGGTDNPEARAKMMETIPIGRFATPADVGNAAAYLASDEANYCTGISLDVDGGRGI